MNATIIKNPAAVALGKLGGSRNTPAQNAARAKNGKLGGRPKNPERGSGRRETAHRRIF